MEKGLRVRVMNEIGRHGPNVEWQYKDCFDMEIDHYSYS